MLDAFSWWGSNELAAAAATKSLQSCLTLCDPIDGSSLGSSVPGILQARTLEWVAISSSRGSSQPREWIHVSLIGRGILYHWTTWEASTIQQERFLYILSSLPICVYTHIWVHTLAHLSQTGCLKHLFIKLGSSQSRHHQIWYLVSLCFLVHRRISSSHILTSQKCQGRSLQSLL